MDNIVCDGRDLKCSVCGEYIGFVFRDENKVRYVLYDEFSKYERQVKEFVEKNIELGTKGGGDENGEWEKLLSDIKSWGERYEDLFSLLDDGDWGSDGENCEIEQSE